VNGRENNRIGRVHPDRNLSVWNARNRIQFRCNAALAQEFNRSARKLDPLPRIAVAICKQDMKPIIVPTDACTALLSIKWAEPFHVNAIGKDENFSCIHARGKGFSEPNRFDYDCRGALRCAMGCAYTVRAYRPPHQTSDATFSEEIRTTI
jgi:hypothetical protein